MFELNIGGYGYAFLGLTDKNFTILSAKFDVVDARINFSDTDSLGVKVGSVGASLFDFNFIENSYSIVDIHATALNVGIYTQYLDIEILLGSVGLTIEWNNGALKVGFSFGWGLQFTIRFW